MTHLVNEERLVKNFCHLVSIDSGTGNERQLADELTRQLTELGLTVREDRAGETIGGNCGNLIAVLPGTKDDAETIVLSSHMDRVEPGQGIKPQVADGIIRSGGDTILASDDVAGLAEIIEALTVIKASNMDHGTIEVVFTIAEEGGLNGAKALDAAQLSATMGFIFDGGGPVGHLTVQAPAQAGIVATFHGEAAHAGIAPEKGINALKAASIAVANMTIGRIDEETTANIGVFQSGRATNIVPDQAMIKGEARSRNPEKLKHQVQHMVSAIENACTETGAKVDLKVTESYPAFNLTANDAVVQVFTKACEGLGLAPKLIGSGGGSDANILNGKGLPCVVLGMGFEDVHSTHEYIPVEQLRLGAELAVSIIKSA